MFHKSFVILFISTALALPTSQEVWAVTDAKLSVTVGGEYMSQPYPDTEEKKYDGDFITTVAPKLDLSHRGKRYAMSAFYRFFYKSYNTQSELDSDNHKVGLDYKYQFSRSSVFTLKEKLIYTQDSRDITDFDDTGQSDEQVTEHVTEEEPSPSFALQTLRSDIINNALSASLKHKFTDAVSGNLSWNNNMAEYDDNSLIDTRGDTVSAEGSFKLSSRTETSVKYSYSSMFFDAEEAGVTIESHQLSLSIKQAFSESFSGLLSAGAYYSPGITSTPSLLTDSSEVDESTETVEDEVADENGDGDSSDSSWIGKLFVTKKFRDSTLKIGYSRGVTDSSGLTSELNVSESVFMRWSSRLGKRFNLSIHGNYSKNQSRPSNEIDVTSYGGGINGSWKALSWMSINLGYSHYQQDSNSDTLTRRFNQDKGIITILIRPEKIRL